MGTLQISMSVPIGKSSRQMFMNLIMSAARCRQKAEMSHHEDTIQALSVAVIAVITLRYDSNDVKTVNGVVRVC